MTSSHLAATATTAGPTGTGSGRVEVPLTLAEPVPQPLGLLDQLGLWGNLGVSLLGFTGAIWVLQPNGPARRFSPSRRPWPPSSSARSWAPWRSPPPACPAP